jgi:hypothetical protein
MATTTEIHTCYADEVSLWPLPHKYIPAMLMSKMGSNVSRPDHREPLFLYGVVGQGVTRGYSSLYFLCWSFV